MKLTENFITNSIDQKSKQVIGSLEKSNETNITQALANIKALEQSLTLYKNALKDFCDLSVEKGQLLAKYSKDTTGQSYNLPGVFASSYGGYDIQLLQNDIQFHGNLKYSLTFQSFLRPQMLSQRSHKLPYRNNPQGLLLSIPIQTRQY